MEANTHQETIQRIAHELACMGQKSDITLTEEQISEKRANWPLGLESTGEDIANAVYFLSSDQAKTITGAELAVDSGLLTCLLSYSKA